MYVCILIILKFVEVVANTVICMGTFSPEFVAAITAFPPFRALQVLAGVSSRRKSKVQRFLRNKIKRIE